MTHWLHTRLSRLAYTLQLWAWRVQHHSERRKARRVDKQTIEQLSEQYDWWRWKKWYERRFR